MIIAIDGPSGAGKSTVARRLAARLDAAFLDTGAMYRAVTARCLAQGIAAGDEVGCERVARSIEFSAGAERSLEIDGSAPGPELRSPAVTAAVSEVSAHRGVREVVVEAQRALAEALGDVVAEGRDMTTVVFPRAEFRIFLDASPAERARRRAEELGQPERVDEIRGEIERRDAYDSSRAVAPLRRVPDQIPVDTDGLSIEQVVERLERLVNGGRS